MNFLIIYLFWNPGFAASPVHTLADNYLSTLFFLQCNQGHQETVRVPQFFYGDSPPVMSEPALIRTLRICSEMLRILPENFLPTLPF